MLIFQCFNPTLTKQEENCEGNGHSVCVRMPSCSCRTALESLLFFIWTVEAVPVITFFVRCSSWDGTINLLLWNCITVLHTDAIDITKDSTHWDWFVIADCHFWCHSMLYGLNKCTFIKFRQSIQHEKRTIYDNFRPNNLTFTK